jgi:hypothetical protein
MPTRYSFERALNSKETAVTSVFCRVNRWLINGLFVVAFSAIKLIEPAKACSKLI